MGSFFGESSISAGATIATGLSAVFSNCRIYNSSATTSTSSGANSCLQPVYREVFFMNTIAHTLCVQCQTAPIQHHRQVLM
jgi:hypothetical protein